MKKTYEENRQELTQLLRRAEYLKYTLNSLLYWDKITHMPAGGIGYRSQVMGFLGEELYKLMADPRLAELISYFENNPKNDRVTQAMISRLSRSSMYVARIPQAEYTDYIQLVANAEQVWETAREQNNFLLIQPYLERLMAHYRRFAQCWGYEENPYDGWLSYYEEGFDSQQLDGIIAAVKPAILELLEEIRKSEDTGVSPKENPLGKTAVNSRQQLEITENLLNAAGFSFQNGRVDVGAHPTILSSSPMDVRLVTSLKETDLRPCVFNAMYLAGKGLYEQQIDSDLLGTMLAEVSSFALEEAVGRLYENSIGRSRVFWDYLTPKLRDAVPSLADCSSEELFQQANRLNLTPIRLDADELTFMLHIIIRCELERELMAGALTVSQLPEAWNAKYKEYLGIDVPDNGRGVLQDIHWVAGYFGYFASYLLAGLTSAQLARCIEKDTPGFEEAGAEERLSMYRQWLTQRVFRFGASCSSAELVEQACGEPLKADYYIDYLKDRFADAYELKNGGK